MSHGSTKSHAGLWTIGIVAAVVLYVITWPFVENHHTFDPPQIPAVFDGSAVSLDYSKPWVRTFYAPLRSLRDATMSPNPIAMYWSWCMRLIYPAPDV
jgi:hypothetical protein